MMLSTSVQRLGSLPRLSKAHPPRSRPAPVACACGRAPPPGGKGALAASKRAPFGTQAATNVVSTTDFDVQGRALATLDLDDNGNAYGTPAQEWGIFVDTAEHLAVSEANEALRLLRDSDTLWTPACTLFLTYALANAGLQGMAIQFYTTRPSAEAMILVLITSGLVLDNLRLAGSRAGVKFCLPAVEIGTRVAYTFHCCVPLLVLPAISMCGRAGLPVHGPLWQVVLPGAAGFAVGELIKHEWASNSEDHGELVPSLDEEHFGFFCLAKKKHELLHTLMAVIPATYITAFLGWSMYDSDMYLPSHLFVGSALLIVSSFVPPRLHMFSCNLGEVAFLGGFLFTEGWLQTAGL